MGDAPSSSSVRPSVSQSVPPLHGPGHREGEAPLGQVRGARTPQLVCGNSQAGGWTRLRAEHDSGGWAPSSVYGEGGGGATAHRCPLGGVTLTRGRGSALM